MSHQISYGKKHITFDLEYRDRQTMAIEVHPDGSVLVAAPQDTPLDKVEAKVRKRAAWITRQQERMARLRPPIEVKDYQSGETHRYLGRQYRLKIVSAAANQSEAVKLRGKFFWLYTHQPYDPQHQQSLLERWYRKHAEAKFQERMARCHERVRRYDLPQPEWQIKRMTHRWGSHTPSGRILLNLGLIQAPIHCIDYVILHELCHLRHPNHSPDFYRFLERVLPDWRQRKQRLEEVPLVEL